MFLLIDNFDSFTHNLVQAFQALDAEIMVIRNNRISVMDCIELAPSGLLIGPGPGTPANAGISKNLIASFAGKLPILGVCLGHQCIGEVFGGKIVRAKIPMHGKVSQISHNHDGIFRDLSQSFLATRYHSLIVQRETLPEILKVTAWTNDGEIMGLQHKQFPIFGVQFHPESILTVEGMRIMQNFSSLLKKREF